MTLRRQRSTLTARSHSMAARPGRGAAAAGSRAARRRKRSNASRSRGRSPLATPWIFFALSGFDRLHGRVPTDDVSIARLRLRWNQICLQPITLDQVSFDWNGPLQILGRKIHQAHPSLQLRQDVCRLAERVEDVANLTTMEFSLSDGDHLRRVRERHREAERLGSLEVGDEIELGWRLLLANRLVLHRA